MKCRVVLPLILLMLCTILLAVESAPSNVVGYVKYPCVVGLDFVATPMTSTINSCAALGAAYPGMLDQVSYWNSTVQNWMTAVNMYDGTFEGDFPITNGMPILVYAVSAFNFYSMGGLPVTNPSYSLVNGLSTLMIPLNRSDITSCGLLGTAIPSLDQISYWNTSVQNWATAVNMYDGTFEGDFPINIGMPLMVYNVGALIWPTAAPASKMTAVQSK